MSEMLERVARAIVRADEQNGGAPWDHLMTMGKHVVGPVYDRARAAIEAMREPTDVMLEVGVEADAFGTFIDGYQAIIDAALKE